MDIQKDFQTILISKDKISRIKVVKKHICPFLKWTNGYKKRFSFNKEDYIIKPGWYDSRVYEDTRSSMMDGRKYLEDKVTYLANELVAGVDRFQYEFDVKYAEVYEESKIFIKDHIIIYTIDNQNPVIKFFDDEKEMESFINSTNLNLIEVQ